MSSVPPIVISPVSVTSAVEAGKSSVDPASTSSPEKLAVVTLGSVTEPPVNVMLPVKVVHASVTWASVPSSVTSTPFRLVSSPSCSVLPPVSVMLIPCVLVRLVSPARSSVPPLAESMSKGPCCVTSVRPEMASTLCAPSAAIVLSSDA